MAGVRLRSEDATHWILPDPQHASNIHRDDQGWRTRVMLEDEETFAEITDEQVFPEVIAQVANHIRTERGIVRVRLDEARWLRGVLDEVIAEMESRWKDDQWQG